MPQSTLPLFEFVDKSLLHKSNGLLRVFEDIHNHIYANEGLSPQQSLDEVIKILFIKIFDEKNESFDFRITLEDYEEVQDGVGGGRFIKEFRLLEKKAYSFFEDLFEKDEFVKLKNTTMAYIVNKLQNVSLLDSSNDIKGLAFQKFLSSSERVGRGQFFTPEQIIKLCVEIIKPKADEKVLDPACGSGGFLSSALQYMSKQGKKVKNDLAENNIYGIEINRTAARIAKMRMILEGDGFSNIVQQNALIDIDELGKDLACSSGVDTSFQEHFDIILTNPPFGTQGKISDKSILKNYELGYKWNKNNEEYFKTGSFVNGQVPEILFIERSLQFLKPGGRMAIVLPNGDFENSSLEYLRNYIRKEADIFSIIKLPQETFIPSGTGVKTSILFLRKKDGIKSNYKVFFAEVTKLGYLGNKNATLLYKRNTNGSILTNEEGDLVLDEDISNVISEYLEFKKTGGIIRSENSFLIDSKEISNSRFDLEYYKPKYQELHSRLLNNKSKPLGDLVDLNKVKSRKLRNKDQKVEYVELSDISCQYNEIINSATHFVYELPSRASYEISEGEIITAVAGNSIGTEKHVSAYVTAEYDGAICTNGFRVLKVKTDLIHPFYLLYYLRSPLFLEQIYRYRTGAAIPSILDEDLLNSLVYIPSMDEQSEIAKLMKRGFEERVLFKQKIAEYNLTNLLKSP